MGYWKVKATQDGVILQEVSESFDIGEIVDCNNLDIRI